MGDQWQKKWMAAQTSKTQPVVQKTTQQVYFTNQQRNAHITKQQQPFLTFSSSSVRLVACILCGAELVKGRVVDVWTFDPNLDMESLFGVPITLGIVL